MLKQIFKNRVGVADSSSDAHVFANSRLLSHRCINIVYDGADYFLRDSALIEWLQRYEHYVICGTGGSIGISEVFQCFFDATKLTVCDDIEYNVLKRVYVEHQNAGFIFISKSGTTYETLIQLRSLIDYGLPHKQILIVTQQHLSPMRCIAEELCLLHREHPEDIGGRFAAFSIVGLLPLYLAGQDVMHYLQTAADFVERGWNLRACNADFRVENATSSAGALFLYEASRAGANLMVNFVYGRRLSAFNSWLSQLIAESCGKNSSGILPLGCIGPRDQHSVLQFLLDGACRPAWTFIADSQDVRVMQMCENTFADVENEHMRLFKIRSAENLYELLMHFIIEVILFCDLLNINAFSQEAVEQLKQKFIAK